MLFLYRFRLTLCLRSAKDKYLFLLQTTHFAIKTKTKHPPSSSADLTRTCIRRRLPFAFDTLHISEDKHAPTSYGLFCKNLCRYVTNLHPHKLSKELGPKRNYFGAICLKFMRQIRNILARFFRILGARFTGFSAHKFEKHISPLSKHRRVLKKTTHHRSFLLCPLVMYIHYDNVQPLRPPEHPSLRLLFF